MDACIVKPVGKKDIIKLSDVLTIQKEHRIFIALNSYPAVCEVSVTTRKDMLKNITKISLIKTLSCSFFLCNIL